VRCFGCQSQRHSNLQTIGQRIERISDIMTVHYINLLFTYLLIGVSVVRVWS